MKWLPTNDQKTLAVVDAKGSLTTFDLSETDVTLKQTQTLQVTEKDSSVLLLSLDWFTSGSKIASSDSKGSVHVSKVSESNLSEDFSVTAHDFECWITCFDYENQSLVYSGGDDAKLKSYDTRINPASSPVFVCKEHMAGVTSLLSPAGGELLSGR